jgi:cell division protein FtsB
MKMAAHIESLGVRNLNLVFALRRRGRGLVFPLIVAGVFAYTLFHLVHGDRGLIAGRALQDEIDALQSELEPLREEREVLDRRVRLLNPDSLDPDMLDEWARRLLNYGRPDEIVIFVEPRDERREPRPQPKPKPFS